MALTQKKRNASLAVRQDLRAANTRIANAQNAIGRIEVQSEKTYKNADALRIRKKLIKVGKELDELEKLRAATMNKTKGALVAPKPRGRPAKH